MREESTTLLSSVAVILPIGTMVSMNLHRPPSPTASLTVIVAPSQAGGYWAELPTLPGCVVQGDTVDAVVADLTLAAEMFLSQEDPPADTLALHTVTVGIGDATYRLPAVSWQGEQRVSVVAIPLHDRVAHGKTVEKALAQLGRLLPAWIAADIVEGENVPVVGVADVATIHPRVGEATGAPLSQSEALKPEVVLVLLRAAGMTKEQLSEMLDYEPE
ncbi:MAG: type II toxin-antitoxin system HicB family antitoxin [Chloroflexi bacterium]|nr:type II toxin-antitoxin system HicB family antitoxin [Chloroflexota bacterium]